MARVLVVEDEALVAMFIAEAVAAAGHATVGPYHAVDAALAALEREPISAALLDVNLGRNGLSYPVAADLVRRSVPFAFMTGYTRESIDPAFRAAHILRKPIAFHTLQAVIAALVAS